MNSLSGSIKKTRFARITVALFAVAFALSMLVPARAFAYFSLSPVGVYLGTSSVSLTQGEARTVSVSVDMWSEQQLPGCGMSICPQGCGNLANPTTGVVGGCLNDAGWCTCGGTTYYTEYTKLSASSSNPSVARASISGGSMTVQAYSPGTTTITVYCSLAKHQESSTSMTVSVAAPSKPSTDKPSGSGSSGSGSSSSSGSSTSSGSGSGSSTSSSFGSGSSDSGKVTVSSSGASVVAAAAATAEAEGKDGQEQEVVEIETEEGDKIIVVEAKDAATAKEELAKIAGTEGTCTFWSGGSMDSPSISWTFKGTDLDPNGDLSFDPGVTVTNKGTGEVAELLDEADDAIVMDFAHSGDLPAPAEVYVRASGVYEDGQALTLFVYNEDTHKFEKAQEDIKVANGYAVFTMDHCSTWALSAEDLTTFELTAEEEAEAEAADVDASTVDIHAQDGTPLVIAGVVAAVVVIAIVAGVVVARRRKTAAVSAGAGAELGAAAGEAEAEGEPEAANATETPEAPETPEAAEAPEADSEPKENDGTQS